MVYITTVGDLYESEFNWETLMNTLTNQARFIPVKPVGVLNLKRAYLAVDTIESIYETEGDEQPIVTGYGVKKTQISELDKKIKQIEGLSEKRLQTILAQRAELARLQSKEQPPCENCKHRCREWKNYSEVEK